MAYYEKELLKDLSFPFEVFIADGTERSLQSGDHYHDCFEIMYTLHGHAIQYINSQHFDTKKDDIVFIKCGDIHHTEGSQADNTKIVVIKFLPGLIEGYSILSDSKYIASFLNFQNTKNFSLTGDTLLQTVSLIFNIIDEYENKANAYELYIKGYILTLIGIFVRNKIIIVPNRDNSAEMERMVKILRYIEDNYASDISLSEISDELNMNYSYTSRYFKKVNGFTFKEYCDYIRVCEANKLILKKNHSLSAIALKCGFSSPQSFSRTYKRVMGYSPISRK